MNENMGNLGKVVITGLALVFALLEVIAGIPDEIDIGIMTSWMPFQLVMAGILVAFAISLWFDWYSRRQAAALLLGLFVLSWGGLIIRNQIGLKNKPVPHAMAGTGKISSPTGASAADPTLSGIGDFYFNLAMGASEFTEFLFFPGNLHFTSDNSAAGVDVGDRRERRGQGQINGQPAPDGLYGYELIAIDGDVPCGENQDRLRFRITDPGGRLVYDNMPGADIEALPPVILEGSIDFEKPGSRCP